MSPCACVHDLLLATGDRLLRAILSGTSGQERDSAMGAGHVITPHDE